LEKSPDCVLQSEVWQRSSRRIGGAKVLLVGVFLWSLGTLLAPPAAHLSLLALCASRVFVRAPFPPLPQL
jgi:hypothetical protein